MQAKMNKSQDTPVHSYTEGFEKGFADGFADGLHDRMELEDTIARNAGPVEFETEEEVLRYMDGFIDGLDLAEYKDNAQIEALQKQVALQGGIIRYGGATFCAIAVGYTLAFLAEHEVHRQILTLLEDTRLLVENQEDTTSLDVVFQQMYSKLAEVNVRSFRHPFGIPKEELDYVTSLLVDLMKRCSQLQPAQ